MNRSVVLAALLALAVPGAAQAGWGVSLGARPRRALDSSTLDLVSDDEVTPGAEVSVARTLDTGLELTLGFLSGGESSTALLGRYRAELTHQDIVFGVAWARPLVGTWLLGLVRAEGGVAFHTLDILPNGGRAALSDLHVGGRLGATAGLRWNALPATETRHFGLCLDVEAGYVHVLTVRFNNLQEEKPEPTPNPRPIAVVPVAVGALDLSGVEGRVAVALQF